MKGPLEGIKVLDLSRVLAGPFCAMLLGDMGAEVVKVERKGRGDDSRDIPPCIADESIYYMVFNRNKAGVTLNFRHPKAPQLLHEMVRHSDVLIENFRAGTMEKMGCGYETLKEINPRLVMVRISGYGQDGPYSSQPCYDDIAAATSGLMDMTGIPEGPPTLPGSYFIDYGTGLYAALGALAALRAREITGVGQMVDVALLDTAISFLVTAIPEYILLGRLMTRIGSRDKYGALCNIFQAADGRWVYVAVNTDAVWAALVGIMDCEQYVHDPRFSDFDARSKHLAEGEEIIGKWIATLSADEAVARMRASDVTCARVNTVADAIENPQVVHRGSIVDLDHPTAGRIPVQGPSIRFSDMLSSVRCAPPVLGQHNDEVYASWLGLSPDDIAHLRRDGVI